LTQLFHFGASAHPLPLLQRSQRPEAEHSEPMLEEHVVERRQQREHRHEAGAL